MKKNDTYPVDISGLVCVSKSALIALSKEEKKDKILIITYNEIEAQRLIKDLSYFTDNVIYFPKKEISVYDYDVESSDLAYKRIEVLKKMITDKSLIVVTTIEAVMQKMIDKKSLFDNILKIDQNDTISLDEIKEKLVSLGYERKSLVENRAEFSIRGDILDIAIDDNVGIRIELWGDEIDSIRKFNISSQRSTETVKNVEIYPAKENILVNKLSTVCNKIEINKKDLSKDILSDMEEIREGNFENKIEKYFNEFYEDQACILDYAKGFKIFVDEPDKIEQRINGIKEDNKNLIKELIEKERQVPEALENILEYSFKIKNAINLKEEDSKKNHFEFREVNLFKGDVKNFEIGIKEALSSKKKIVILAGRKQKQNKEDA